MDADPTIRERYDETGQRQLLRDAALLAERVAICVASGDPDPAREYAEWTAPLYRRRRVPMDDLVALCEGLRAALPSVLAPGEIAPPRPPSTPPSRPTAGIGESPGMRARRTPSCSFSTRAPDR